MAVPQPLNLLYALEDMRWAERAHCDAARRHRVIRAFGCRCEYCLQFGDERLGPDGHPWHVDRIIPSASGGGYQSGNITLACRRCNLVKGSHLLDADFSPLPEDGDFTDYRLQRSLFEMETAAWR